MIVVTGAAGFIGSNLVYELIQKGYKDIVCVDLPGQLEKSMYYEDFDESRFVDLSELESFIKANHRFIQFVIHLGACSDTTNPNINYYIKYNLASSKAIWGYCVEFGLPLIYASSAATYGDGTLGYNDNHGLIPDLEPLNYYGWSKNEFDKYALSNANAPFYWAGLKFFNVYGPNENHKNGMSSVVQKAFHQITSTGRTTLFASHNPEFKNGYQTRDFIYVKDVCDVIIFMMEKRSKNGIFNVGTGIGRTFLDLAMSTFSAMKMEPKIDFINTPEIIRDKYQYFTEAEISKLRSIGYHKVFYTLEDGIKEYVNEFLKNNKCKVICSEAVC